MMQFNPNVNGRETGQELDIQSDPLAPNGYYSRHASGYAAYPGYAGYAALGAYAGQNFTVPSSDSRRESFGHRSSSSSMDSLSNIWRTPSIAPASAPASASVPGTVPGTGPAPTSGHLQPCWNIWASASVSAPPSAPPSAPSSASMPAPLSGSALPNALSTPPSPPVLLSFGSSDLLYYSAHHPHHHSHSHSHSPAQTQAPGSSVSPHWPHYSQYNEPHYKERDLYFAKEKDPSDKWGSPLWVDSARASPPCSASSSTSSVASANLCAAQQQHSANSAAAIGAVGSFAMSPRKQQMRSPRSHTHHGHGRGQEETLFGIGSFTSPPSSPKTSALEKASWLLDTPDESSEDESASPASPPLTASPLLSRADLRHPPLLERRASSPTTAGSSGSAPMLLGKASPKTSTQRRQAADTDAQLFIVQFKGQRQDVYTGPAYLGYHNGQLVIVDADRGKDLGKIIASGVSREQAEALKLKQQVERQSLLASCAATTPDTLNQSSPPTPPVSSANLSMPKQILRTAAQAEVAQLATKRQNEAAAVALCNEKARERGLDMSIADAEYQWDRRKLTFFYRAGHRVDFRELVRELFRTYKTRIWMCAVPAEA